MTIEYCKETEKMLDVNFSVTPVANYTGQLAMRSILLELSATPKPGLVDRANGGSHSDMNYETFVLSTSAISPYFIYMAREGEAFLPSEPPDKLLPLIRRTGLLAEKDMFSATGGINTQKGIIFLIGLTCASAGYLLAQKEIITPLKLSDFIKKICVNIVEKEFSLLKSKKNLTSGEKMFLKYNISGVRGESQEGFPSVINYGLPALKEALNRGLNLNNSSLHALCHIMARLDDTALLHRHDLPVLRKVQKEMYELSLHGGLFTDEGKRKWKKLEHDYNCKGINPGGSADMLAVTLMFYFLECSPWRPVS